MALSVVAAAADDTASGAENKAAADPIKWRLVNMDSHSYPVFG
ncbi:MAG: hypothetical protein QNK42_12915 [Pseudodonghicola sp.]|nr:hypothetical protein [Pseudodonghicola sp.]